MRNILYVAAACLLLFSSCKHKPTAQELATDRADSITQMIANHKSGFPVSDLLVLPNIKWAVITAQGNLSPDTLILVASVGDKVCLTNIRGIEGKWQNVKDEYVPVENNHIQLAIADISSSAIVDMVLDGDIKEVVRHYSNREKTQDNTIRDFVVKFYSSSEEEQKKMLTVNARNHLTAATQYDFCINGGLNGHGGIGEIFPKTIKIKSIDKPFGHVAFTMEVNVVGFEAGEMVYQNRETSQYSFWLKREKGAFLVDDMEVPFTSQRLSEY